MNRKLYVTQHLTASIESLNAKKSIKFQFPSKANQDEKAKREIAIDNQLQIHFPIHLKVNKTTEKISKAGNIKGKKYIFYDI